MATQTSLRREAPSSREEAADILRAANEAGQRVRIEGGGTKLGWGNPIAEPQLVLSTENLSEVVEHNAGDFTAVVQAGLPLSRAQAAFAEAGQTLALDPPTGPGEPTIGGLVSTADSGPLRQRYGGVRDLVIGVTLVLADGTIAKAGGKVIKNVAGYDLAKLFSGAYGTLGLVAEVSVRLHPISRTTATAVGRSSDPARLAAAATMLAHSRLEKECIDVRWAEGRGAVFVRFGGLTARRQAEEAVRLLGGSGVEPELTEDEAGLWEAQRAGQRSADGVVARVSGVQTQLETVLRAAHEVGGTVVGRAGLGLSWVRFEDGAGDPRDAIGRLRAALAPSPVVVLDAPVEVRADIDVWGEPTSAIGLMRRVKERFDPQGIFNRGMFVGGI